MDDCGTMPQLMFSYYNRQKLLPSCQRYPLDFRPEEPTQNRISRLCIQFNLHSLFALLCQLIPRLNTFEHLEQPCNNPLDGELAECTT